MSERSSAKEFAREKAKTMAAMMNRCALRGTSPDFFIRRQTNLAFRTDLEAEIWDSDPCDPWRLDIAF